MFQCNSSTFPLRYVYVCALVLTEEGLFNYGVRPNNVVGVEIPEFGGLLYVISVSVIKCRHDYPRLSP